MPFTDITGFCFFAEAKFGSNGSPGGVPEYVVGRSGQDNAWGRKTWDGNVSNGVDSDWVNVNLVASAGGSGGVSWQVQGGTGPGGGSGPLTYSRVRYGYFSEFRFRAGVRGGGVQAGWKNVMISCYSEGDEPDRPSFETGVDELIADRWHETQPDETEQVYSVPLIGMNSVVKVELTGQVKVAAKASFPEADAMFAQVFFFAQECSVVP